MLPRGKAMLVGSSTSLFLTVGPHKKLDLGKGGGVGGSISGRSQKNSTLNRDVVLRD